jgi:hypothetical protein
MAIMFGFEAHTTSTLRTIGNEDKEENTKDVNSKNLLVNPSDATGGTKVRITLNFPSFSIANNFLRYLVGMFPVG